MGPSVRAPPRNRPGPVCADRVTVRLPPLRPPQGLTSGAIPLLVPCAPELRTETEPDLAVVALGMAGG